MVGVHVSCLSLYLYRFIDIAFIVSVHYSMCCMHVLVVYVFWCVIYICVYFYCVFKHGLQSCIGSAFCLVRTFSLHSWRIRPRAESVANTVDDDDGDCAEGGRAGQSVVAADSATDAAAAHLTRMVLCSPVARRCSTTRARVARGGRGGDADDLESVQASLVSL